MRDVVTGVDQQQSPQVLAKALAEARTGVRPLRVLHAWSTRTWLPDAAVGLDHVERTRLGTVAAREVAADSLADALIASLGERSVIAVAQGRHGDPGEVLVRAGIDAGLVVVGARSHGPLLRTVLGSATTHLLQHSSCPVMVVPRTTAPGPYRRVVLGYDRAHAGSALLWALDAARRHRCPLLVVHALRLTASPASRSAQRRDALHEDQVRTWLAEAVRPLAHELDVEVTTTVRDGSPFSVLLGEAGPQDLLVVGARARSSVAEALLGAVAVQCAQAATGPVVVVRAGQERLDSEGRAGRASRELLAASRP